jgi:hypothetical protein
MSYVPPHLRKATATKATATKASATDTDAKWVNTKKEKENLPKAKKEDFPELGKPLAKPETKTETKPEVKPLAKPEVKALTKTETKPEVKPLAKPEEKHETNLKPKMDFSKLFKNAGPKPIPKKPMKRGLVLLSKTRPKDSMTEEEWNQEEEERMALRTELHFQKITLNLDKRRNQMREYDPSYESEQVITSSSEEDPEEPVEEEVEVEVVEDELEDE